MGLDDEDVREILRIIDESNLDEVLFDTSMVDPAERSGSWSEAHERIFFPIGVRFAAADASLGKIQAQPVGPLGAYRVVSDPSVVRRTRAAIRAADPESSFWWRPRCGDTS